jgi:hypothetical protein
MRKVDVEFVRTTKPMLQLGRRVRQALVEMRDDIDDQLAPIRMTLSTEVTETVDLVWPW